MKNFFLYLSLIGIVLFITKCTDINDFHDKYLKNGEIIYAPKIDSVEACPGYQRILLRLFFKDERISDCVIFWDLKNDSLIVPIRNRTTSDYFDVVIDSLVEKSYVFEIFTMDSKRHRSIKVEKIANVYGEIYRSSLGDHPFESSKFNFSSSTLTISLFPAFNEDEIGVEFKYQDKNTGSSVIKFFNVDDLKNSIQIVNIDKNYPVLYRTLFLPEPQAIDTFKTDFKQIDLIDVVNVALNKPVRIREGDIFAPQYTPDKAVDGIISNASRWVSSTTGEHWLEIDLGQEYNVFSFKTLTGSNGVFNYPTPVFKFQIEVDDEWVTIVDASGNSNPQYEITFPEIKTSKVRYYVPTGVVDNVRLYEIEVYAKIKY